METILPSMVCFLLVLSFKSAHAENQTLNLTTPANPGKNLTEFYTASTSFNSTGTPSIFLNSTKDTTVYTSTKQGNDTYTTTAAATENSSPQQTSQSPTILTLPTDSGSFNTDTPTAKSSTLTETAQTIKTSTHFNSTSDTPEGSTSSHSITTSTDTVNTTEGLRLNISERNMTIIFSGMLGLFALAIGLIMFYKCKHKFQYMHQPLNNTDDTAGGFVADEDTLVISGGLYDGHPIYDNVPPTHPEQSQFRLEFLY